MTVDDKTEVDAAIKSTGDSLTNWKNEPSLQQIKHDFEQSKTYHDAQMSNITRWKELLKAKRKGNSKNRSNVQPKLIRRQAEWRYSALTEPFLGTPNMFTVSPHTFEDAHGAEQNQILLNWQFATKLNKVKFIDDYVRATVDEGTCFVKLGWARETVPIKEEVPVFSYIIPEEEQLQEYGPIFEQAMLLSEANPREFMEEASEELKAAVDYFKETQQITIVEITGSEIVETKKVIVNHPTLSVEDPNNVFIDPSCGGEFNKALFAIFSFETNYSELKKEGKRYTNLDKVNWTDGSIINDPDHESKGPNDFQFNDKARKRILAYEYWGMYDIEDNGVLVPIVCTWIGNTIIRMEKNPFPDQKIPLVVVPYMPLKRELYGETDAELLEDNQAILGATTRGMIDLLGKSANAQQGFAKGMLDPLNRRRFDAGDDYEYNPNTNPHQSLVQHKYPELPQSGFNMLQLQNQEAEGLTGVKSFSGGVSGQSYGNVAKGINSVLDAAAKREMAILRRLAQGMKEIGEKFSTMNAAFLSEEEVVRVTNSKFVTVKREELAGNYDFLVDISTAEVDNAKANDLGFMMQTMGNSMDFGVTKLILTDIAKLKRMPELANKIETYEPQPDPLAEKLKELQVAELEAKIAEIQSQTEANQARAKKDLATADQASLDFVEQETGTKHARDMEKTKGQSEGNRDLEITKSMLKSRKPDESEPDIMAAIGYANLANSKDDVAPVQPELPLSQEPLPGQLPINQEEIVDEGQPLVDYNEQDLQTL